MSKPDWKSSSGWKRIKIAPVEEVAIQMWKGVQNILSNERGRETVKLIVDLDKLQKELIDRKKKREGD